MSEARILNDLQLLNEYKRKTDEKAAARQAKRDSKKADAVREAPLMELVKQAACIAEAAKKLDVLALKKFLKAKKPGIKCPSWKRGKLFSEALSLVGQGESA